MHIFLLYTHSWLRWIVLLLIIVVVFKSLGGLFGGGTYKKLDNILAASFVGTMHLQLLIGLILYFATSALVAEAHSNMGAAMKEPDLRFWAVEHITLMVLAVIFAQVGRSISKKSEDDVVKFRFQSIFFGASFLMVLLGIPWTEVGRMFRF